MGKGNNWKLISKRKATETLQNRDVYETQQLERGQIGQKQTFLVRNIIAIILSVMAGGIIWVVASFFDIGTLDNKSLEDANLAVVITSPAPAEPRKLDVSVWLNMLLVPDNTYAEYGYKYRDTHTNAKYSEVEYELWLDYQRMFNEGKFPQLLQKVNSDGTYYYVDRDPLNKAPNHVRSWSPAHMINMIQGGIEEDDTYADLGYSYVEHFYGTYLTRNEYEALRRYTSDYINTLIANGEVAYSVENYTNEDGESAERYIFRDLGYDDEIVPQVPDTPAGDRYVTPIEKTTLEWANMLLVQNDAGADFGYSYVDTRTGLFYTQVEYEHWADIYPRCCRGEEGYTFWMEISDVDGEFVFYDTPEYAPTQPRPFFDELTVRDYIFMNMEENDFWARYGYHYYDYYTGLFYTNEEYAIWATFQNQIATGDAVIPQNIQSEIRSGDYEVTDIVRTHLDPLPVKHSIMDAMGYISFKKIMITLLLSVGIYAILRELFKKGMEVQNLMEDNSDINQYEGDQHIALPEEIQKKFDWFPDVGAHCPIQVSSMISHMMLTNKGINKVKMVKRAEKDIVDKDGNIQYYKGQALLDNNGEEITEVVPLFDSKFAEALYEASNAPTEVRKYYDPNKIPYNPEGRDRTKQLGKHKTVAEAINNAWTFPSYEPQRPAGAYMVDTEPVKCLIVY